MSTAPERSLRARIGGLVHNSLVDDGRDATRRAREIAAARLEDRLVAQVDPDRVLGPEERAYRLHQAKRAHFAALALRSAVARRRASKRPRTALRAMKEGGGR